MTEILLIRHGETHWNVEKRVQGHLDIALNAEGERQAAALGDALSDEKIDVIYASDLQRARQTAQAIAAPHGMQVRIERDLRERSYGAFEGMLHGDINTTYPDAYTMLRARDIDARFPMGVQQAETLRELSQRAVGVITRLANEHRHKKIVIVSHGGVLECIYRAANRLDFSPPRDFDIKNASINRLLWDGESLRIAHWSDVRHLAGLSLDEIDK
ncbi:MAG: histidine phosphatase family protein [Pseudomonadota bacterium]